MAPLMVPTKSEPILKSGAPQSPTLTAGMFLVSNQTKAKTLPCAGIPVKPAAEQKAEVQEAMTKAKTLPCADIPVKPAAEQKAEVQEAMPIIQKNVGPIVRRKRATSDCFPRRHSIDVAQLGDRRPDSGSNKGSPKGGRLGSKIAKAQAVDQVLNSTKDPLEASAPDLVKPTDPVEAFREYLTLRYRLDYNTVTDLFRAVEHAPRSPQGSLSLETFRLVVSKIFGAGHWDVRGNQIIEFDEFSTLYMKTFHTGNPEVDGFSKVEMSDAFYDIQRSSSTKKKRALPRRRSMG